MKKITVIENERKNTKMSIQYDIIQTDGWYDDVIGVIFQTGSYSSEGYKKIWRVSFNDVEIEAQPVFDTIEEAIEFATS